MQGDATAYTFMDGAVLGTGHPESLTWAQVYRRTLVVAEQLRRCGSAGDRAAILAPQGLDYIVAFFGALQAGFIAVPLSVPEFGVHDHRVFAALEDSAPVALLTTSSGLADVNRYANAPDGRSAPEVIEVDILDTDRNRDAPRTLDTTDYSRPGPAYLQYTSGSTRTPAGVIVSHRNVTLNVRQMIDDYFNNSEIPNGEVVSWLPFYHDMGLMLGVFAPLMAQRSAVLTSPLAFLSKPASWMQLIAAHPGAFSAAPNFAFEFAVRRISDADMAGLDLSDVVAIISGAERVHHATVKRFTERFAPFGLKADVLRPSYGLAEATLHVAAPQPGQPVKTAHFDLEKLSAGVAQPRMAGQEGTTELVSYGVPRVSLVRIVDPETGIERSEGDVGEIWVHGDNIALGYWHKPEQTERTFRARINEPTEGTPAGPWLRTGDLGVMSRGELFIMGRLKDLLIVHGRNHYPDDIEATIQEITGGRVAAIAVEEDATEKLVTIIELKARGSADENAQRLTSVKHKVAKAVWQEHNLRVGDPVLVEPGSIPITTSGKTRRSACAELYRRGEFQRLDGGEGLGVQLAGQTVEQQLQTLITLVCATTATVLAGPDPAAVDADRTFADLGVDSLTALELRDALTRSTGLTLPPTVVFDQPTPAALAKHLSALLTGTTMTAPVITRAAAWVDEPVAVVGMACRFPGGVDSPAALWDLVADGREAVAGFPTDRGWDLADLFDPDPDAVGKTYTRDGSFLSEVAGFDAEFFGISAREARIIDPQQRLLLEVCWEALENAAIAPGELAGSDTGVFVGTWSQPYGLYGGSEGSEGYALTGLATSVASGRVAYFLGLQGPAITLDTACSSSLVATHLACQSLRSGESNLALAAGVTIMTSPAVFIEFSRQRGLARDGRCKAFSAEADGTGWGEGAGVIVLERLSDAHRNHHHVLAIIAGTAVNQDGASNGLTAPNGPAQQRVIHQALANAGLTPEDIDVVEAHGTGTALGDPIEAGALLATYGADRNPNRPLWLGSIKSNIGHTQAAAGVAGMIKMIQALNHDTLPATLHAEHPSPHIDWSPATVRLLTEPVPWPETEHPRNAAVSSFGISGTNAHVILQQAPTPPTTQPDPAPTPAAAPWPRIWTISARTPKALTAQAHRLHQHLTEDPDLDLTNLAYSLATTRTHHPHRAAITEHTSTENPRHDLLQALHAVGTNQPHPHLTQHHTRTHQPPSTVFILPGQGAQYPGMGQHLYQHHHTFATTLDEICTALDHHLETPLRDVIFAQPDTARAELLNQTAYTQPALFALGAAMHALFTEAGITPDYLLGHSIGELTAAYCAGVLTLPDAALLVAARGRLMQACPPGAMLAIHANQHDIHTILGNHPSTTIAAINGPTSTIISGPPEDLDRIRDHCTAHHHRTTPLPVSHAFHSPSMDPALPEFQAIANTLTLHPPTTPILSNLTGKLATAEQLTSSHYWTQHLRQPVRFHDNITHLLTQGDHTFLELSPHPQLAPTITETLTTTERTQSTIITTLHRNQPDLDTITTALAKLHNHNHSPTWKTLYPNATTTALPTYPFQHHPYWTQPTPTTDLSGAAEGALWKAVDNGEVDTVAEVLGMGGADSGASLGPVVRALREWHTDLGIRSAANTLRYRVGWQDVIPSTSPPSGRWLVLVFPEQSDGGWISGLSAMPGGGVEVSIVDPNNLDRDALSAFLTSAYTRAHYDGIVSFLATDERAHPDFPGVSIGLLSTLLITQAHCDAELGIPLWVVTQGAVSVSGTDDLAPSTSQSAVWGLGQSICLEHPDQWGGLIDLAHTATPRGVEQLSAILACPQSEDQLAIRRHGVSARRLYPARLTLSRLDRAPAWKTSGTALVTGATGRLAKPVVQWLVEAGAGHVALLSRSAAEHPRTAALERELHAAGSVTTSVSVDVTDRSALAAAIARIRSEHGPIRTVVHAAADLSWTAISAMTAEEFCHSYAAKAVGADNLVALLEDEPPDTFVLFSSAAATWGGARQGSYAAANAHLDALAAQLRNNGRTALSVGWGLWADETGDTSPQILDSFHRMGINQICPKTALAALRQALEANDTQLTIADVSWDRFLPAFTARRSHPLLTELASPPTSSSTSTAGAERLRLQLAGQTAEQQRHTLNTLVCNATAGVLAHPDPAALDTEVAFKDLGIDSLTALELRDALTRSTGLTLPPTVIFDQPTPAALTRHLHRQLTPDDGGDVGHPSRDELLDLVASIPIRRLREEGILDMLVDLADPKRGGDSDRNEASIASMELDELMNFARSNGDDEWVRDDYRY